MEALYPSTEPHADFVEIGSGHVGWIVSNMVDVRRDGEDVEYARSERVRFK